MLSDLNKAPLKREESPSCAASTVAPTLSRQNSAESAFSAAPRRPLSPAHTENHWKPVDAELRRPAGEDVQSMVFPSKASMVQSRFAIRMGEDTLCGELVGVDEQRDVPAVTSDVKQSSKATMVQNRFAIRMDVDHLFSDVPGESGQYSQGEVLEVPAESKLSSTQSLAQKRFAIRMREEVLLSGATKSSDSSMQITASTQRQVQPPNASKTSTHQAIATSHLETEPTAPSANASLAQKRFAIRMGDEISLTSQILSTTASSLQPGQLQEVQPPRQPTFAEKRFTMRMSQDDREAVCFALATNCQRFEESSVAPPVHSGSSFGAPRAGFAETRFAMRMHDFASVGVF